MKVDVYTKCVLSVIAACLLWLCVQNERISTSAHATTQVQERPAPQRPIPVYIVGVSASPDFPPAGWTRLPVRTD
jgi:hypothetical protein